MQQTAIWVIGTDPPCPRCDLLGRKVKKALDELDLECEVSHFSFIDQEALDFAAGYGLVPGTAKDVAAKAGLDMDWDVIYAMIERPQGLETIGTCCCQGSPAEKWSPELDEALRPCQEKALEFGVMMTPVLVVDGHICHQGSVPNMEEIKEHIAEAAGL